MPDSGPGPRAGSLLDLGSGARPPRAELAVGERTLGLVGMTARGPPPMVRRDGGVGGRGGAGGVRGPLRLRRVGARGRAGGRRADRAGRGAAGRGRGAGQRAGGAHRRAAGAGGPRRRGLRGWRRPSGPERDLHAPPLADDARFDVTTGVWSPVAELPTPVPLVDVFGLSTGEQRITAGGTSRLPRVRPAPRRSRSRAGRAGWCCARGTWSRCGSTTSPTTACVGSTRRRSRSRSARARKPR